MVDKYMTVPNSNASQQANNNSNSDIHLYKDYVKASRKSYYHIVDVNFNNSNTTNNNSNNASNSNSSSGAGYSRIRGATHMRKGSEEEDTQRHNILLELQKVLSIEDICKPISMIFLVNIFSFFF